MSGKTEQVKGANTGTKKLESEGNADRLAGEITDKIAGFVHQTGDKGERPLTRSRAPSFQSSPDTPRIPAPVLKYRNGSSGFYRYESND
jgi:hypothetical protein